MRRMTATLILMTILATLGCSLAEAVFWSGGNNAYSAGSDFDSRSHHFDEEHRRWQQYENER